MAVQPSGYRVRIEHLLHIDPETKPKVYLQVFNAADVFSLNYALELLLSAGIATLGLVLNSPAVVIGAMLISPLMGPIIAAGLAFAASDLYLGIKSLISIFLSTVVAIMFSAWLVWLLPFHLATGEILARTQPNLLDLGVALFSGLAGSIVVCRGGGGGGVTALPGVAIAVALMPPLCTIGFGVGSGLLWSVISGASLLFVTNLAAIIASAFLVFFIVRMDSPDLRMRIGYSEIEQASPDRLYRLLAKTRLSRSLGDIGHLRWRILMLLVTLLILFIPLRKALYQLRDETISRGAVQEALRSLGPPSMVLTQQLDIQSSQVVVQLVVAAEVPAQKVRQAERLIIQRTGKDVSLVVRKVASAEELASLRDRLRPAPAPEPAPLTMENLRAEVLSRIDAPLKEAWPAETAPLLGYEFGFAADEAVVRVRYESRKPLDATVQEMMTKVLQTRLQVKKLRVILERERPSPRSRQPKAK